MARTTVGEAAGRVAAAIGNVAAVVVLSFALFRLVPGDPVGTVTRGRAVTPDQVGQLRADLGVQRPWPAQFLGYVRGLLHGDLGISATFHRPVTDVIAERLGPTLLLTGTATAVSAILGLWLGSQAGWRPGSRLDRVTTGVSLTLWSVPAFWLGLLLMTGVGVGLDLLPTGGMRTPGALSGVLDVAAHLVLPVLTLVLAQGAQYVLVARAAMLDQHGRGYLRLAEATGLRDAQVRRRHAVPNALLPSLAVAFTQLGYVVAGVITVETVFSWPGLGRLTHEALALPDLPLLHGLFLLVAAGVVTANTIADGVYRMADPRLRAT